jgi:hypothetical protein
MRILWDNTLNLYVDPDGNPLDADQVEAAGLDPGLIDVPSTIPLSLRRSIKLYNEHRDQFAAGYLDALAWLTVDDTGHVLGLTRLDVPVDIDRAAREDALAFYTENGHLFVQVLNLFCDSEPADFVYSLGIDFVLTRCGHGNGYWDRGFGELGDRLTGLARPYGEAFLLLTDSTLTYER